MNNFDTSENHLILTKDGSHSLLHDKLNETYHSVHGAIQESKYIFIESGLKSCSKNQLHLLEIGLGTGLNAFLTLLELELTGQHVVYTAVERYPLPFESACLLNYPDLLAPHKKELFYRLHTVSSQSRIRLTPYFEFCKIAEDFPTMTLKGSFDLIYFDAFSPEKQPEMWTQDRFEMICKNANPGAVLTTYCAKGSVRRTLQSAGFAVERLPGPPGKREILRATKI